MVVKSTPLITIIVAVYNGVKTLQQCIDSVVNQSFKNIELIIIDGGSDDGTVEVIKSNSAKISYWISEPDKGIYNAWNKGLNQAKGDWVAFLGADDYLWNDDVITDIEIAITIVPKNIRVVYGQIMLLNEAGVELFALGEPWKIAKYKFKRNMSIPHQGVFHQRTLFKDFGLFDESFKIAGDYEFLLRELLKSDAFFIKDLVVSGMRQGGVSSQCKNSLTLLNEIRRAQFKNGLLNLNISWWLALLRVYVRIFLWKVLGEKIGRSLLDFGRKLMGKPAIWTKS